MKKILLFLFSLILMLIFHRMYIILSYYYYQKQPNLFKLYNPNPIIISNSVFILSCFYDKRYNILRAVGLIIKKVKFTCEYQIYNKRKNCLYRYNIYKKDSAGCNFISRYMNIFIYIQKNDEIPKEIIIDNKLLPVYNENKKEKKNVLCITTIRSFQSYNLLVETLLYYIKYGVTDIYLYVSDNSLNYNKIKILNASIHIINIFTVDIIRKSFYFGQTMKYNDCLYRNMYISSYIIFTDFDELIVLKKAADYNELFKITGRSDIYYFRSAMCPTTNYTEKKHFHIVNDVNIATTSNCCIMEEFYHKKYIIRTPYKFVKINIHYIDYNYGVYSHVYVNLSNAYIHHSRIPTHLLMNHCSKWFYDDTLSNVLF